MQTVFASCDACKTNPAQLEIQLEAFWEEALHSEVEDQESRERHSEANAKTLQKEEWHAAVAQPSPAQLDIQLEASCEEDLHSQVDAQKSRERHSETNAKILQKKEEWHAAVAQPETHAHIHRHLQIY